MRVQILGTRGAPASYSGFETCVEEVGARLAQRGHQVTVYCRAGPYNPLLSYYRGMRLVWLPAIRQKHLETITHTALSLAHALQRPADAALFFGVGNAPLAWLSRRLGRRTIINVDGLDWQRKKWEGFARRYLRWCERVAVAGADVVVTDSLAVQRYFLNTHQAETTFIGYGATRPGQPDPAALDRFALRPREYILFVGRLVPESRLEVLIAAHRSLPAQVRRRFPLVIMGDPSYSSDYYRLLRSLADEQVVFTGYLRYGDYLTVAGQPYLFALPTEVGGLHPSLIEAMGFGNCVVVFATDSNLEAIADAGLSFGVGASELTSLFQRLIDDPGLVSEMGLRARGLAAERYSWEAVTDKYERLLEGV